MKNVMIGVLVILLSLSAYRSVDVSSFNMGKTADTNAVVQEYYTLVVKALDASEKKLLTEVVKVDDDVARPDPDPKKCPCKGTGLMPTDGSVVIYCKYHGNKSSQMEIDQLKAKIAAMSAYIAPKVDKCTCTQEEHDAGTCKCGKNCTCWATRLPNAIEKTYFRKDRAKNTAAMKGYQVVMFTAKWCAPCQAFKNGPLAQLATTVNGLEISDAASADFRVLDVDDEKFKSFYHSLRGVETNIPLFVELRNNTVISKRVGTVNNNQPIDVQYLIDTYDLEEMK